MGQDYGLAQARRCPRCRYAVAEGQRFCSNCSLPLDPASIEQGEISGRGRDWPPGQATQPLTDAAYQQPPPYYQHPQQLPTVPVVLYQQRDTNPVVIVLAVIGGLTLLGCGACALLYFLSVTLQ